MTSKTYTLALRFRADDMNHATRISDALFNAAEQDAEAGGFELSPRHSVTEAPNGTGARSLVDLFDDLVEWAAGMGYDFDEDPAGLNRPPNVRDEAQRAIAQARAGQVTLRERPGVYVCEHCNSEDITLEAQVSWNQKTQDWDIEEVDCTAYCMTCEKETNAHFREYEERRAA